MIYFDFSGIDHKTPEILAQALHSTLNQIAKKYTIILTETLLKKKFAELIATLGQTKGSVAIIVDEYDKPITNLLENLEQAERSREELRDFYGTLKEKDVDANVQFLFVTGVSKFSKVELFSDLKNLADLTNDERAAALVGYTDQEVDRYFTEHIKTFAQKCNEDYAQTRATLKKWYNGYRFSADPITVYNPFSLHSCLTQKALYNYWFSTGTPTFLMNFLKKIHKLLMTLKISMAHFLLHQILNRFLSNFTTNNIEHCFCRLAI